jgi:hypothetical protein
MITDSPARTAPPEYGPERHDFNDLPLRDRLDAVSETIQRPIYKAALQEALCESDQYETWLRQLLDSSVSNADVGRAAREIVCAYIAEVAGHREEEI